MRIGIDASRAFVDQPTGTERYATETIDQMLRLEEASEVEWVLYCKRGQAAGIAPYQAAWKARVHIQEIGLPYLWTQAGLAARTWTDTLDALWIPAHTLPVLRRRGLKTVVTIHGIEYEWLPAYENALQRWYLPLSTQYAVAKADTVIAVSEFTRSQLIERLGANGGKIVVIPEGITGWPSVKTVPVTKWGLEKGKYFLFIGTVQPRKNLERLVEAFSGVKGDWKLVIAGKLGWNYEGVQEAPAKRGVADRVIITGYINETERYSLLTQAGVYIQPSITEGFGLPVLEAMSAGVPVATSSGGALHEVAGGAAEIFDPLDVLEMTKAMTRLHTNKELRRELIRRGRTRAGEFTWKKTAEEILKVFISLKK